MLNCLCSGMTTLCRLKVYSRNGQEYKWDLETLTDDHNWTLVETFGLFNLKFWHKTNIKYLQNDLAPMDDLNNNMR